MKITEKILEALQGEVERLKGLIEDFSEEELMELDRINITLDSMLLSHKPESRFVGFTKLINVAKTMLCEGMVYTNGYIAIPPEHPLNGVHYSEINLGDEEWTYSESANEEMIKGWANESIVSNPAEPVIGNLDDITSDWWIIGFDTMHWYDNSETRRRVSVAKRVRKCVELLNASEIQDGMSKSEPAPLIGSRTED